MLDRAFYDKIDGMQIIPVASGKGGVGKSLLSANLAIALGQAGKRVLLVDLDLGASNLHLVLGHPGAKEGIGTFFTGQSKFEDIIHQTDYMNVSFIAGDSEIPGLTSLKVSQKNELIRSFNKVENNFDYLILDLGAGTHLTILDMFLLSPQGIVVTAPTVTATLNGYLFLKNVVFRMMYNTFKKGTPAYNYLETLKKDSASLQRLYIPKLLEILEKEDSEATELLKRRMKEFHPSTRTQHDRRSKGCRTCPQNPPFMPAVSGPGPGTPWCGLPRHPSGQGTCIKATCNSLQATVNHRTGNFPHCRKDHPVRNIEG